MIPSEEERQELVAQDVSWATRWLQIADPGDRVVYHEGWLMTDRLSDPVLNLVAETFLMASEAGQVELKQRRVGDMRMEYIAQRRAG